MSLHYRMSKYYLTTPIYYVNDKPHIGHTYTTVAADTLARFHRLLGDRVRLVTGTDENSQKNVQAMEKAGESNIQAYLDRMSGEWKQTWQDLGITVDDFIRTTDTRHLAGVERFWRAVEQSGDLEKRTYEGLYCVGCEAFKTESEILNGRCLLHPNKDLDTLSEENWFFKLSNYREALLAHLDTHPEFVQPESRRNEIRSYIEKFMTDVSVSREVKKVSIGIPVPGDDSQRIYVWFDALLNYMTAVGYGTDDDMFQQYWPADLQLVGKDIIKFHCALWPAMIMSAAKHDALLTHADGSIKLPRHVFAHGFFTIDGQKISKSLGNAIDPRALVPTYGFDAIRYYLLREISFGEDGDFSHERLQIRYASDLGNTFGNLVNRVVAMSKKYFDGGIPQTDLVRATLPVRDDSAWDGKEGLDRIRSAVESALHAHRPDLALEAIWNGVGDGRRSGIVQANKLIEETQPFKLVKESPETVAEILYALLEACRYYAWFVQPFMPEVSSRILAQLGLDAREELARGWVQGLAWGGLTPLKKLGEPVPLFPRIEVES